MWRARTQLLAIGLLGLPMLNWPAGAASLDQIRRLENLINASGSETVVSAQCPPDHAGYDEHDGKGIDRLVICRRQKACTGTSAIADDLMPRLYRELQTLAPHHAKLVGTRDRRSDQRLEAEAFWMELQPRSWCWPCFAKTVRISWSATGAGIESWLRR